MENKTVLADVGGFTPVIDTIVDELGFICANVFGVIWRYCQMSDGKCTASQSRIAEKLGLSVSTVKRCAEKLVEAGYLRSNVKKGVGVEYYDTGLAGLRIQVSGYTYHEVKNNQALSEPAHRELPTQLTESYLPSSHRATKIDIKKDLKDTATAVKSEPNANSDVAEVFKVYEQEIGMITSFVRDDLLDALEQYPKEWIIEAIKESAKNNARKWSYAEAILKSWKVNGYKTDIRSRTQNGKSKQGGSKSYISPGLQKMLEEEKAERMRLYGGDDDE